MNENWIQAEQHQTHNHFDQAAKNEKYVLKEKGINPLDQQEPKIPICILKEKGISPQTRSENKGSKASGKKRE